MKDQPNNPEEPVWKAPNDIELRGSVNVPPPMMSGTLQIAYADRVLVEDSQTLKRLHKPGVGDYLVYSRVSVVVSGQEPVEITTDASPEEVAEYGPNPGPNWYGPV